MRITELFTAQSIALDEALTDQEQIISRLVELQATHGNITDKEAYKKALYAREAEGSTYVDNGITVPHAKTNVVTRPSLAALRLSSPVQYNAEDDGTTDLLFAIAAPENGSLHVDMLARMMQMLMNEDFVEKLKAAKNPKEFLECIDAQEEAQFGAESFTQQAIPQEGYRILAVTACVNGIAHTYMAAEALTKAGDKLGLPTKVETNGSDGAKNILTREEIANCDGIIVAAEKKVETARFDGKPVLFTRVDDGIHKPEELIKKIVHGEVPVYHAEGGAQAAEDASGKDSFGRTLYKNLMNGVSHMLPFVVGGGIMIALAFLLDDYTIDPSNFGMNTPAAAFFKTVGSAAFGYMLPILSAFIAMSIADRPGLAVGFAGGVLAMNGTNFAGIAAGETTGVSGGFLAALLAGAAEEEPDPVRRRVLEQLLYHLGRWIYLVDAADDLKKDVKSGSYNPLVYRFHAEGGTLTADDKAALAATLDSSVRAMAAAFELADFGPWRAIIESVVYEGLYAVGAAVLNGTFRKGRRRKQRKAGA